MRAHGHAAGDEYPAAAHDHHPAGQGQGAMVAGHAAIHLHFADHAGVDGDALDDVIQPGVMRFAQAFDKLAGDVMIAGDFFQTVRGPSRSSGHFRGRID